MRNFMKILCVVLALVVALSAASCSLSKQYSYKTDDVELPIGVYIYYLRAAYDEAQSLAQKSDKYDSEAGTYDGSKSFLKMEITDEDGKTAVAEDWIKEKAEQYMNDAVAVYYEYNKLGASVDEAQVSTYKKSYREYWDNGIENYYAPFKNTYEPYGIGFDSFFTAEVMINLMSNAVFKAEYAADGPAAVSDEEVRAYYEENYTSYHYFSADLYTTDAETSTSKAKTDEEVKKLTEDFKSYADAVNSGKKISEVLADYNTAYNASATVSDANKKIDAETTDDLEKAVLGMKDGEAKTLTIGSSDTTRKVYVILKDAIADTTEEYFKEEEGSTSKRDSIVSVMKEKDFKELLKTLASSLSIDKSSAMKDYKPSMFES